MMKAIKYLLVCWKDNIIAHRILNVLCAHDNLCYECIVSDAIDKTKHCTVMLSSYSTTQKHTSMYDIIYLISYETTIVWLWWENKHCPLVSTPCCYILNYPGLAKFGHYIQEYKKLLAHVNIDLQLDS